MQMALLQEHQGCSWLIWAIKGLAASWFDTQQCEIVKDLGKARDSAALTQTQWHYTKTEVPFSSAKQLVFQTSAIYAFTWLMLSRQDGSE